jgi:hypothetical protein
MEWVQLAPLDALDFYERVRVAGYDGLLNRDLLAVHTRPLPFFRDTQHILLENLSSAPSLCLEYLWSGSMIAYLDASEAPIRRFCDLGLIHLDDTNIVDYLEFHCLVVVERPNNIYLLKNYEKIYIPGQSSLDFQFDRHRYSEKDIVFTKNEDNSGYIVQAPFVFDGRIDPATAFISYNGAVDIKRRLAS